MLHCYYLHAGTEPLLLSLSPICPPLPRSHLLVFYFTEFDCIFLECLNDPNANYGACSTKYFSPVIQVFWFVMLHKCNFFPRYFSCHQIDLCCIGKSIPRTLQGRVVLLQTRRYTTVDCKARLRGRLILLQTDTKCCKSCCHFFLGACYALVA